MKSGLFYEELLVRSFIDERSHLERRKAGSLSWGRFLVSVPDGCFNFESVLSEVGVIALVVVRVVAVVASVASVGVGVIAVVASVALVAVVAVVTVVASVVWSDNQSLNFVLA